MPISWLDIILIVIMLISGFLAMVRGFTREVLSIFSWAMAAVAALYFTPRYSDLLTPYIENPSIAQIVFAPVTQVAWAPAAALGETARGAEGFGHTGL